MAKPLILASNNAKKLHELQALLSPLGVSLLTQGSLGIAEAEEPHLTFIENALAKARHAAREGQGPAIADDSGLCVAALGGAPGVRSARYAVDAGRIAEGLPREQIDAANNAWLLDQMRDQADRRAHFTCLLVAVRHADDPEPLIATGHWAGTLLDAPRGAHGFGYDPLLWIDSHGASAAELPPEVKNAISHRALACTRMRELIATQWGPLDAADPRWPWQGA
ncbi:RdgB/HAM1 family non-canonical purine NTP pyrophosphatase [Aquabacterium fontiphilum]|uniref:RdgB/HAM1 family non-canonical purine NTP pyrophosphatase n=1 Tax=Aquabacterium fontiphilum TaxID=450365 RepID=UPI001378A76C|nr:RdgB/HAM1 family non-canonical purine NTP pyrophosphatase [Aquabacterium fontiphilum]NBD19613.1 RdgB/HAM1 family non-canonical purine NTP pyrophosphatase [Aquabacterium fontiphilum]